MRTLLLSSFLLLACRGKTDTAPPEKASPAAPAAKPSAPAAGPHVDACAVLTKAEVEALVGKPVTDGHKEEAAELSVCVYGNPEMPMLGGRPTDIHLSLGVFSGSAPGQARGVYDIAKNNAGKPQEVSGLGEVAFWDNSPRTLRAVKGNHMVDLTIGSDLGGLKTAQAIAAKTLAKLP